jgi:hypothetical protein
VIESAQLEDKLWETMWSPDRTRRWLIWIGFLACSLVAADDALGLAAFLFGVFGLSIYYRETLRRARPKRNQRVNASNDVMLSGGIP